MQRRPALSLFSRLLIALSVLPIAIVGFRSSPPPQTTGAPGEETCWQAGCHMTDSGALIEDSGAVSINFPDGATYSPGVPQNLQLQIDDPAGVVFGFELSARDPANAQAGNLAAVDASTSVNTILPPGIQYLGHNINPKAEGVFDFEWTPPPADVGTITMYVAANAANGNQGVTGNRIHLQSFEIDPAAPPGVPTINEGGVAPSNTFNPADGLSSNTFGSIFGVDLTSVTLTWDNAFVDGVAPTMLGGAQVLYDGEPAFISFVGEGDDFGVPFDQINFVAPTINNKGAGGLVPVQVVTAGGTSAAAMVIHQALSPSFFPLVAPNVAAVHLDGTLVGPPGLIPVVTTRAANPGDIVLLFGTGFGPTTPPVPVGTLPGTVLEAGVPSATNQEVKICFGDVEVTPLFAGLSGFVGLYQITVTVPDVPAGDAQLLAKIGGLQTQDGITIRIGAP